jgi:DNA ligase 1
VGSIPDSPLLLEDVTRCSRAVEAVASKKEKTRYLAELLGRATDEELPIVIAALSGEPRQGRVGVGWATVYGRHAPPTQPENPGTPNGDASPTLLEFDALLERLQLTTGPGSVGLRQTLLDAFMNRCGSETQTFISQLLTGGLRQGALHSLMVEAAALALGCKPTELRKALTLHADLGALAVLVREKGAAALTGVHIVPGRPLQPMLAATAESVETALREISGPVSIEWKLDGARIQVHRFNDTVRIFTRNLNDVTDRLPTVVAELRALPATTFVADGEVMGFLDETTPARFQDTMSDVGKDAPEATRVQLRPYLFDLLHLDGADLVERPLHERLALLDSLASHLRVPGRLTDDLDDALAVQTEALGRGHEGVMVKDATSTYEAGRRGSSWRKVKPVHTFDLVVLAAEWGHGRRTGWLSNLHLGARNPETNEFVMVGKTFKGLTDALLTSQTAGLLARETHRAGITVWVRPELVVEIALDGVQRSTRYPGGIALRFARVKRYRPDRTPESADTIDTLRSLQSTLTGSTDSVESQ